MSGIQALVDGLAERIGQPVGVDDRRYRTIAYSSHADEIDPVRRTSILGRQAPERVTAWLDELGVPQAAGFVRVPGNAELTMVPRVCFPLRFRERLHGFLWLTDEQGQLSDEALAEVGRSTEALAQELARLDQQDSEERRREADAVRRISGSATGEPPPGGWPIAAAAHYAVAVADVTATAGPLGPHADVRLSAAADRVRRAASPRHLLSLVQDGRLVVVLAGSTEAEIERRTAALLSSAELELSDLEGAVVTVGVGLPRADLDELPRSRREAELASRVARSATALGPLVLWSELGAYRLVAELVGERDPASLIPASLRALLDDPDGESLVRTVEAYLEHGGDVSVAAAELFIHRSSLYNRLHRVEELAGVDMRSGSDRLELQLGLRIWRLAGCP